MHIELELLIRYSDGELDSRERGSIERHLARCAECRLELDMLRLAADPGLTVNAPTVEEVLADAHQWQADRQDHGINPDVVRGRVAAELNPYLGRTATSTVLASVSPNCDNLLSVVEPVLAIFLGRCAARQFVSHVVDTAIVRI